MIFKEHQRSLNLKGKEKLLAMPHCSSSEESSALNTYLSQTLQQTVHSRQKFIKRNTLLI